MAMMKTTMPVIRKMFVVWESRVFTWVSSVETTTPPSSSPVVLDTTGTQTRSRVLGKRPPRSPRS